MPYQGKWDWIILCVGDVITLGLVTLIGFSTHRTLDTAGARMLTTFIPLVAGWFMVAPFIGAYDFDRLSQVNQVWRPFWAMVLAGPMAGFLRGVILNSPILWLFVLILGGISALAILTWRVIFWLLFMRKKVRNG